jgi:hypothetical protein
LDVVGIIATVLNSGFDVGEVAVASGPIVTGTLKMAQSSAIAEKVTVEGEHLLQILCGGSLVPS